ncbi:MAG: hypothetical protein HY360_11420 [Verrucomicrobia bacterium]|nr:hypothetical protein [Verrucomicrobiota bacterium]
MSFCTCGTGDISVTMMDDSANTPSRPAQSVNEAAKAMHASETFFNRVLRRSEV